MITGCRRSQNEKGDETEGCSSHPEDAVLLALKVEDGTAAKGCRQPPEARKGKDRVSPHCIKSKLFSPYPEYLEQCLTRNRSLVNIC